MVAIFTFLGSALLIIASLAFPIALLWLVLGLGDIWKPPGQRPKY